MSHQKRAENFNRWASENFYKADFTPDCCLIGDLLYGNEPRSDLSKYRQAYRCSKAVLELCEETNRAERDPDAAKAIDEFVNNRGDALSAIGADYAYKAKILCNAFDGLDREKLQAAPALSCATKFQTAYDTRAQPGDLGRSMHMLQLAPAIDMKDIVSSHQKLNDFSAWISAAASMCCMKYGNPYREDMMRGADLSERGSLMVVFYDTDMRRLARVGSLFMDMIGLDRRGIAPALRRAEKNMRIVRETLPLQGSATLH